MSKMTDILISILVNGMFSYACWFMCRYLDGPFDLFKRIRSHIGIKTTSVHGIESVIIENKFLAKLLDCVWCTSVWVAFAGALYMTLFMGVKLYAFPFVWLCAVTLAGYMNTLLEVKYE